MAILALLTGIIGINISNTIIDQRFRNEVSRVVDQIRLAQDLMLILGTDVHLIFAEDESEQGIKYWLELETGLPDQVGREVKRPHALLKTIRGLFIEDTTEATKPEKGKIDLLFLSGGSVMSKGVLRLSTSDKVSPPVGALNNFICLPGYPHPIFSVESSEEAESCLPKDEEDNDKKLTQDTMNRLPEKIKDLKAIKEEQKKEEAQQQSQSIVPAADSSQPNPKPPPLRNTQKGQTMENRAPPK